MDKTNLYKAIELAKGPGQCRYVADGKPCCVIGQLFILEGGSIEELNEWGGTLSSSTILDIYRTRKPVELKKYPFKLLNQLQNIWDDAVVGDIARARMKEIVDATEN